MPQPDEGTLPSGPSLFRSCTLSRNLPTSGPLGIQGKGPWLMGGKEGLKKLEETPKATSLYLEPPVMCC